MEKQCHVHACIHNRESGKVQQSYKGMQITVMNNESCMQRSVIIFTMWSIWKWCTINTTCNFSISVIQSGHTTFNLVHESQWVNPLHAKFFRGNIKHIFILYVIPPHWYDTGGWNPSSNRTRTYPFYTVNIMAAGVLAPYVTRTSAAMILT